MIYKNNKEVGFIYKNNVSIDKIYKNNQLVFEQGFIREQTGIPPITTSHETLGKDLKDYKIYGQSLQGHVPSGYTEVEYLEGSNSGYIPTDIYLTGNDTVKMKYKTLETRCNYLLFVWKLCVRQK